MRIILAIITLLFSLSIGYFGGIHDGLYRGAIEYQYCVINGATGWYVERDQFNCVF